MIENEEEIWDLLNKFNVNKLSFTYNRRGKLITEVGAINRFMFSLTYTKFVEHINRVMMIYPKTIEKKNTTEISERIEQYLYRSNFLILLINSLETYLDMVFRWATKFLFIRDLNKKNFIKFIKTFRIRDKFFNKLIEKDNLNIILAEILSERMDFQNKDKCRVAYNLINIDLPGLYEDYWHNIFDNEPTSYMQTRHRIIHNVMPVIENIESECSVNFVERALLDIVNYVFFIEEKRLELYPDPIEVEFFKEIETELSKPEDQRRPFEDLINNITEKLKIEKIEDLEDI